MAFTWLQFHGELWSVFCEYLLKSWPCYNGTLSGIKPPLSEDHMYLCLHSHIGWITCWWHWQQKQSIMYRWLEFTEIRSFYWIRMVQFSLGCHNAVSSSEKVSYCYQYLINYWAQPIYIISLSNQVSNIFHGHITYISISSVQNKSRTTDPDRQNLGWSGMLSFFIIHKFWQNCASVLQLSDLILKTEYPTECIL